ncbi:restriction endonuclease subunit S [Pediococcus pentosaceus]|uniref:restriction endonuclease subunit S n=1 Tax=Pediococcus pentosaceus TaxID=1255 RepID=UPI001324324F|nr:restriction endonuclease subunit S [Pediococcus pentosaceus]KAF0392736.1 restriction endonuclease subunit S [Pediococcus pentosaceus]
MKDKHTKYPQLRFKGFTDPWEQRKLGEVFNYEQPTKYIVKSTEYDDDFETPVLTAGKSFVLGYTNENTGIKKATVEDPIVIFDDFTTSSHYVDFPFKIKSSAMKLLSLNDDANDFYFMFNTLKKIKYVPQSHERHWISRFSEFEIYKPTLAEQKKIGSFFHQLDDTITLHQRKLAKLKKLKQGYLQKMFPRNGSKFPQLRFAGFSDAWEERKLGEVYNFQYGQFNNNPDNGGQYPIYGANGIIGGYDEYNSENAIVIGHMGAYAGHVLWAEGKHFVTYNGTMGIADKSILNSNFGYYLVVSINVPKLTAGSGQPFVSYSDLNGIKILIPTIDEQQKIGTFFKQLDTLITLHQRKLEKLQELKKGYLQKMFC